MKTFTQMKEDAAALCGVYPDAKEMQGIARNINVGVKLIQNAARRYWTKRERKTSLVANRQSYQFPSDMLRISSVKIKEGSNYIPIREVPSEDAWNALNSVNSHSSYPEYYFIKGSDEIALYPIPSDNVTDGLQVVFEPRMNDMTIDDTYINVKVEENSYIVTSTQDFPRFVENNCYLTVQDGSDGNWYKITRKDSNRTIWLENYYQGPSQNSVRALIGQSPQFPEEYHDAPVYYAAQQFFLLRKDIDMANVYKQEFDRMLSSYKTTYGVKKTGGVYTARGNGNYVSPGPMVWNGGRLH